MCTHPNNSSMAVTAPGIIINTGDVWLQLLKKRSRPESSCDFGRSAGGSERSVLSFQDKCLPCCSETIELSYGSGAVSIDVLPPHSYMGMCPKNAERPYDLHTPPRQPDSSEML